jgi:hypothetical protein
MTNSKSPPNTQSHDADSEVDDEDSSSDDDIGPKLCIQRVSQPPVTRGDELDRQGTLAGDAPANSVKRQRDDWMVFPPDRGSPSSDKLKLRNRKFNTSKDVTSKPGNFTPWTESHEQKKRRLENEIMGIQQPLEGQRVTRTPKSNETIAEGVKLSDVRNHRSSDLHNICLN